MKRFPVLLVVALFLLGCGRFLVTDAVGQEEEGEVAGNEKVAEIIKTFGGRGTLSDGSDPTPVEDALKQFRLRDGFEIEKVAAEPVIEQPLFMTWDSRGRLWVCEYRQYQFPAGLKIVEYDNHLRAQFDKIPQPPPHGTPGIDRITVLEDTDGDGIYDSHKRVIEGLNIATSVAVGAGGIWVSNPPYLLFYPDADQDDEPDSDPQVMLAGFGIEDTHAVMNSLEWGPDGWLYGVNGSTTTGKVKNPATRELVEWQGQMVWRYHPETTEFEIYAEGGGNTFSLQIDEKGRVFSGTNNGNTRGMHYPQGSYGKKSWGKHGPLTNPYAFGYFDHMPHEGDDRRFAQAFCIYESSLFPESYHSKIIAPNSLQNVVWVSDLMRDGSGYRTKDEENLVETDDRWFRPVFGGVGPDGAVYMGDWYDTRLSHVRPVDDWHKESGRIYRVKPTGSKPAYGAGDLAERPVEELAGLLADPDRWTRRRAVLEIGWRGEDSILPMLEKKIDSSAAQEALEALWAVNLLGGLTDEKAAAWLEHGDEHVRRWVVRLVGDRREASADLAAGLQKLAATEADVQVRVQLAASAKRLPAEVAVPIARELVKHEEDLADKNQPLMVWWAVEGHAESGRNELAAWTTEPETWKQKMFVDEIAPRLMKRYAIAGGDENFASCEALLAAAPNKEVKGLLLEALQAAFEGVPMPKLPDGLSSALTEYSSSLGESGLVLRLKNGDKEAVPDALKAVKDSGIPTSTRAELVRQLGTMGDDRAMPVLLGLLALDQEHSLKRVALQALANFDDPKVAGGILGRYGSTLPRELGVRSSAERVLASRKDWAMMMMDQVDKAIVKARDLSPDVVQLMLQHGDADLTARVTEYWPGIVNGAAGIDLAAETSRIKGILKEGEGDPNNGKVIYSTKCAICHPLFGEGKEVGPDLTGYERQNPDFWLPSILNPSLELREGFINYVATMKDGRILGGLMVDQTPQTVTLKDIEGQETVLNRTNVDKLEASKISLMPPALLMGMKDSELRDLFAYLMKKI